MTILQKISTNISFFLAVVLVIFFGLTVLGGPFAFMALLGSNISVLFFWISFLTVVFGFIANKGKVNATKWQIRKIRIGLYIGIFSLISFFGMISSSAKVLSSGNIAQNSPYARHFTLTAADKNNGMYVVEFNIPYDFEKISYGKTLVNILVFSNPLKGPVFDMNGIRYFYDMDNNYLGNCERMLSYAGDNCYKLTSIFYDNVMEDSSGRLVGYSGPRSNADATEMKLEELNLESWIYDKIERNSFFFDHKIIRE